MQRREAIRKKCLDCSGGSSKEVTLCPIFDCPLWEWRTGSHIKSNIYKRRIKKALVRYRLDFDELRKEGFDIKHFLGGSRHAGYIN